MNNTPISIVLADDEHLIRGALAALLDLEDDFQLVAEVDNGTDALAAARDHSPTVCVLDLEMSPTDGVDAATSILWEIDTRIVMVTRHARPGVLRRALAAGVKGFVPKSTPSEKLAEVIRTVAGGARYVDPDIAASALTGMDCPLTERELHVLRASTEHDTLAQTAGALHLAPGTVRNYVSAAMAKLGASSRQQAAHRAWEEGWI
ncbi:response regulator transcription factor [Kocuria sp. cx-455]|uniref:response regulator transcription factor n=1 Tax=Kocuria sp. cx-455 TaxID=2771377 RepID=UPI00168464DF|nr:response regulator transcription factor [Kocuria sp. cx-455]MBD2765676.1 response regulator transcription factor [Kocuria sp. cx-455]